MTLMVKNLSKSYGVQHLFSNASFFVGPKEKVALVGPNGCGKTTLIRIISGIEKADSGEINMPGKNFRLGVLEQFADFEESSDVLTEASNALPEIGELEIQLRAIEEGMANATGDELDNLGGRYSRVLERYEHLGGYEYELNVRRTLFGIGFNEPDFTKPVDVLSGGERTRLALCKVLLSKPDMLILDEPTNHLDLPSVEWFEEFITGFQGACLIVSHDRFFIDRVADRLIELTVDGVESYKGNYQDFLIAKQFKLEQQWASFEKQQETIGKMERFVSRWSADKIRGSQAKDRQKKLNHLERIDKPREIIFKPKLKLRKADRTFENVLEVRDLYKSFDGRELLGGVNVEVQRGERLAIIGRNGEGKTTFLKCVTGEVTPDKGQARFGGKVRWGYFSQTHTEFYPQHSVLSEFLRLRKNRTEQQARARLGALLFNEDDVLKLVGDISGGERSKLALAVLIDEEPNALVLDEPTNHLDIPSREALEAMLEEFQGTIIFISHDRRFIDRVADKVLEFGDGHTELFHGNYSYYHEKKMSRLMKEKDEASSRKAIEKEKRADEREAAKVKKPKPKPDEKAIRTEKLMEAIGALEDEVAHLQKSLQEPEVYQDYMKVGDINRRIKELTEQIRGEEKRLEDLI